MVMNLPQPLTQFEEHDRSHKLSVAYYASFRAQGICRKIIAKKNMDRKNSGLLVKQ
jgi:hypothetical protein